MAVVEYKGDELNIDASLLIDFQFRTDSLYEFIGEIQASSGKERRRIGEGRRRGCATPNVVGLGLAVWPEPCAELCVCAVKGKVTVRCAALATTTDHPLDMRTH